MSYILQEQYTSKNQVPGAQADSVWHRGARKVSSITIHHWGNKGQQFWTVRDFLCTNSSPTSAHYVVQDGLVACIVSPDDCAFHAGNPDGNSHSIGIECRPEATDGDYQTVAELIRYLRGIYGDIPLRPHNYWYNTACPGDYDLARLDSLSRGGTIAAQSATVKPLEDDLDAEAKGWIKETRDRVLGRGVQRYYNPQSGEVRTEPFPGAVAARSTDVHDIIALHTLINGVGNRILDAVAKVPGVEASVVDGLRDDLRAEMRAGLEGFSVTLTASKES